MNRECLLTYLACLVSVAPSLGCHDAPELPPVQVEGERLAYAADEAYEVCPGTVAYAEAWMATLAERLGISAADILPTTYYFVDGDVLKRKCGKSTTHCVHVKNDRVEVFSRFILNRHELVHVVHRSGWPIHQPILEEGLAYAFDDIATFPNYSAPSGAALDAAIEADNSDGMVTVIGGYLIYWIVRRYGEGGPARLWHATTRPTTAADFRSAFELEFGESLDTMLAEVDDHSCQVVTCFGEPRPWADGRWTMSSPQGCEDDSVVGVLGSDYYSTKRYELVEIAQAGSYDLVVGGEQPGNLAMGIIPCDDPCPESVDLDVGDTVTLELAPGLYRVTMAQNGPDEATKTVEISPAG